MKLQAEKHFPWALGLLLTVNFYLVPVLANSPRATDLAGILLAGWVIFRLVHGRQAPGPLAAAAVAAMAPLIWLFFSVLNGDVTTGVQAARWLLAIPWALVLIEVLDQEESRINLSWGILAGALINVLVIVLQWRGLEGFLQLFGLSSSGANYHQYVALTVRIPGLHGHHNASSSVISLMVPAGLYLYFQGRLRILSLLASFLAFLVALHLTSTRSPLIVAVFTVGFASLLARRFARSLVIGFVIISLLVPLVLVYGPPGGWARWKNTEAVVSNATERVDSTLGAGKLILENPGGFGVRQGQIRLSEETGIGATHNAFMQAGLVFSLPFGVLVFWGTWRGIFQGLGGIEHPAFLASMLALHAAGLFMFEEHLNNPTFIILAMTFMALVGTALRSEKSPAGA